MADDDTNVLRAFERLLAEHHHDVITRTRGDEVLSLVSTAPPDLIIMDIRMPGLDGLEAFRRIRQANCRVPVIIMTGHATMESAIEATKLGAFDYHIKPLNPPELLRSIENALECVRLMGRPVELDPAEVSPAKDAMVGQSAAMQEVYKAIGRVAQTDATVLIRGETGTGKELVARAIYQHSLRAQAPLLALNCAAIPEALLESELFGHECGAFTGAESRRIGKLEQADGGTIFLDEIGDMPPGTQAKLLRVLEDQKFVRVGGSETICANLRVLAATNRDVEDATAQGHFRQDLFHRLNVFSIRIAPLRGRPEDIPRLAAYFAHRFAQELNIEPPVLSSDALDVLRSQTWPGNVRELQHCIHRALILKPGYPIQADDIRRSLVLATGGRRTALARSDEDRLREIVQAYIETHAGGETHAAFLESVERLLLAETLRITGGNQTHAAQRLGMARPTLKAKLDKYGLGRETGSKPA